MMLKALVNKTLQILTGVIYLISFTSQAETINRAENVFESVSPATYQIEVVDLSSGEKSNIGSGFLISQEGLVVSNYHVINHHARNPEKYKAYYIDHLDNKGELTLLRVDILNDLALLKRTPPESTSPFKLSNKPPNKGESAYALGNPEDLGMIVSPGTYNGLQASAFYDRIHFTGSINPGMSGGPVVNEQLEVIGVNVATAGNSIGFLIPSERIKDMLSKQEVRARSIAEQINTQLHDHQASLTNEILNAPWEFKELGGGQMAIVDVPFVECWGASNKDQKAPPYHVTAIECSQNEDIYVTGEFFTGYVSFQNEYLENVELSTYRFYQQYEKRLAGRKLNNGGTKDDITNYSCLYDIVKTKDSKRKVNMCARGYLNHPGLYDIIYVTATIDQNNHAMIGELSLVGFSRDSAEQIAQKWLSGRIWP